MSLPQKERRMKRSNPGCLIPIIFFLVTITAICFVLYQRYKGWETDFYNNSNYISLNMSETSSVSKSLSDKIDQYNKDNAEYVFIELSKQESLYLFTKSVQSSVPSGVEITESRLLTYPRRWVFYFKSQYGKVSLPWFGIAVQKDDSQSIDLYIDDAYIGDYSLTSFYMQKVVDDFNNGLRNGLHVVNDGNFAGRYFENIELGEDTMIIKSRNIEE